MKMDSAIPVEVARFRLGEQLVADEECGSTGHTCAVSPFRRAPQPLINTQRPAFLWPGTRISADFRSDFRRRRSTPDRLAASTSAPEQES